MKIMTFFISLNLFDILDVKEARVTVLQKELKIANIKCNSRMRTQGCSRPDRWLITDPPTNGRRLW